MSSKNRLDYVDVVKGLAILCVVFYHLCDPGTFSDVVTHILASMVIAFFFLSGYFHKPGKRNLGDNIKTRAKSLLIPFFRYSLFFWSVGTVYLLSVKKETLFYALCCLRNFFAGCIWNRVIQDWFGWDYYSLGKRYFYLADFWFLIAMLFASILFFIIADRVVRSAFKTAVMASVLFVLTGICQQCGFNLPYNIQLVPFWTAFMLLGAFAGQDRLFEKPFFEGKSGWCLSIALVISGLLLDLWKAPSKNLFRGSFADPEVTNMLLCIVSALLLTSGLLGFFANLERAGIRTKWLSWLGSHSLLIYLYHMFFAWVISIITGFTGKSFLLAFSCLGLCVLRYVIGDLIVQKRKKS